MKKADLMFILHPKISNNNIKGTGTYRKVFSSSGTNAIDLIFHISHVINTALIYTLFHMCRRQIVKSGSVQREWVFSQTAWVIGETSFFLLQRA